MIIHNPLPTFHPFRWAFLLLSFLLCVPTMADGEASIEPVLNNMARITHVTPLENTMGYAEKFVVKFTQPLSHQNPELGSFSQRVVVMHRSASRPTVIVTEGYSAGYALSPRYLEELSYLFNTNVVFVEHRYFAESTPTPCDWRYMTDRNAMDDLHDIVQAFRSALYPQKWISTGISKGGQTCMEFRAFYPEDVDVSVPYVGPLCYAVEDGRHEPFLRQNGTPADRKRILDFQTEMLKRKAQLLPAFEAHCLKNHLRFNLPMRDIYDYCVLEYSFAHFQWGTPTERIPSLTAPDETLLRELLTIAGPEYFSPNKDFTPFFYQAAYELGYYGYDLRPFRGLTSIKSTRHYLRDVMLPDSLKHTRYHKQLSRYVRRYLQKNDPKMLFIYGQIDPWTAAGVTWLKNKQQMRVYVQPGGSHLARIQNMPADLRKEILQVLSDWIGEKPVIQAKP
ncbi:MAG: aminopeptidase [Bacteroidaceae bacterium]|nr:aminopeptidase [Bacteroidaceae bacterium]